MACFAKGVKVPGTFSLTELQYPGIVCYLQACRNLLFGHRHEVFHYPVLYIVSPRSIVPNSGGPKSVSRFVQPHNVININKIKDKYRIHILTKKELRRVMVNAVEVLRLQCNHKVRKNAICRNHANGKRSGEIKKSGQLFTANRLNS